MKINQAAVAGTLESGDVMIRIAPLDSQDIDLQVNSSVEKQFGDAIRATILDVLSRYNVRGVQLNVDDKGALDCILRARLEALLARAQESARHAGFTLEDAPMTGGGSDANFTSAMGVPTLDGLGADGDSAHTLHEHILVSTLEARLNFWRHLLAHLA